MHCANNAVIMQTKQLGWIEALEEELRSSKAKMVELEEKMTEQDHIIAQLVGDNLNHLQDNMRLTTHINSLLGFVLYPINPGRLSDQCHTGADRCTPKLPR